MAGSNATAWLPRTMTMVLLVIGSLLCGALYVMPVFLMAKGRMVGLSLHLLLARATRRAL